MTMIILNSIVLTISVFNRWDLMTFLKLFFEIFAVTQQHDSHSQMTIIDWELPDCITLVYETTLEIFEFCLSQFFYFANPYFRLRKIHEKHCFAKNLRLSRKWPDPEILKIYRQYI